MTSVKYEHQHLVEQLRVDFGVLDVACEVSCTSIATSLKFRDDHQNNQSSQDCVGVSITITIAITIMTMLTFSRW